MGREAESYQCTYRVVVFLEQQNKEMFPYMDTASMHGYK
jgi:hypothetical protein